MILLNNITYQQTSNCFGNDNTNGQLTIPDDIKNNSRLIESGYTHTCIVSQSDDLKCFGSNDYNQTAIPDEWSHNVRDIALGG